VVATHALSDLSSPLLERLELGPREDDAKLFIVERRQAFDIPQEVILNTFSNLFVYQYSMMLLHFYLMILLCSNYISVALFAGRNFGKTWKK